MTLTIQSVPDTAAITMDTDADTGGAATSSGDQVAWLRPEQVGQHPDNIRDAGRDIPALAASIKEVGVLVPLIVVPAHTVDGNWSDTITHIAVDGNRRVTAAAQVGADLPCLIRDNPATARETATIMAVTGLARDGLTGAEQAHAVQTMLDLGLSQAAIGRATGMKPKTVKTARAAATLTGDAADQAQSLTLDQLATLADYQDQESAAALLVGTAKRGPGTFEQAVARLRQERETQARATPCSTNSPPGASRSPTPGPPATPPRPGSTPSPTPPGSSSPRTRMISAPAGPPTSRPTTPGNPSPCTAAPTPKRTGTSPCTRRSPASATVVGRAGR